MAMFRIRHFKLLYAFGTVLWLGYSFFKLLAPHIADHTPISSGTLFCLLLFVSIPAFGYFLLFTLFPRAGRALKR
jgi:bacteriorhodopsin